MIVFFDSVVNAFEMSVIHSIDALLLWIFLQVAFPLYFAKDIRAYNFGDNRMNVRRSEANGNMFARFEGLVPESISICTRFYPENIRHGNQLGIFAISTPYSKRPPTFVAFCRGGNFCYSESHGPLVPDPGSYPKANLLKKWTSICVGMHFLSNDLTVYYNGKHVNKELEEKRKKNKELTLDSLLPEDYFKGTSTYGFHPYLTPNLLVRSFQHK